MQISKITVTYSFEGGESIKHVVDQRAVGIRNIFKSGDKDPITTLVNGVTDSFTDIIKESLVEKQMPLPSMDTVDASN